MCAEIRSAQIRDDQQKSGCGGIVTVCLRRFVFKILSRRSVKERNWLRPDPWAFLVHRAHTFFVKGAVDLAFPLEVEEPEALEARIEANSLAALLRAATMPLAVAAT